ncbi:hypothetical protein BV898_15760 [Hypsibius exemplaris]|uniref:Uncharacterized protein n=1 Tax=Hypsibius exemplaris TaxID=2072580 RepID=A0A9X6NDP0_HYPEX|nr:hypothetical protein BV898_15760 [Hypsibius exemplaris]
MLWRHMMDVALLSYDTNKQPSRAAPSNVCCAAGSRFYVFTNRNHDPSWSTKVCYCDGCPGATVVTRRPSTMPSGSTMNPLLEQVLQRSAAQPQPNFTFNAISAEDCVALNTDNCKVGSLRASRGMYFDLVFTILRNPFRFSVHQTDHTSKIEHLEVPRDSDSTR